MTPPPAASTAGRYAAPRIPRRVSGPARKPPAGGKGGRGATGPRGRAVVAEPLAARLLRRGQTLADSRLLDRLVRGRLWIPLVAVALVGVVFMQVSMLRLNAGIGRDVESIGKLERDNSVLRADVSRMESGERIQSVARDLGMVVPVAGGFHYVPAGARDAGSLAAARMQPADPEALARAQAEAQANAQQQATPPAAATTTTPSTTTTTTPAAAATTAATPAPTTTTTTPAATTTTTTSPASSTTPAPSGAAGTAVAGGAAAPTGGQG